MVGRLALLAVISAGCIGTLEPVGDDDQVDPTGGGGGNGGGGGGGGGGGDVEPPPAPADFSVSLDTLTADLALGETLSIAVTATSINGFAGDVSLAALDLPDSWQLTFSPAATISVPAGGSSTATAVLTIPTDAEAMSRAVKIGAAGLPGAHETPPVDVTVRPELVLRIPLNALDNPETAFGPDGGEVRVRYVAAGTRVRWINEDTVPHQIHSGGGAIEHQPDEMDPGGGSYEVTLTEPGTFSYNCHIHPQMEGVLVVTE